MGPVFGRKGGATGGGASRIEPSNTINLQFTGDFHAITAAHNLLAAAIDNRLHFGDLDLDPTRILWKRALDMNDRALRHIVIGLGGHSQGVPRESGFDITAASEVMAILCLADSPADLRARLDRILVGYRHGWRAGAGEVDRRDRCDGRDLERGHDAQPGPDGRVNAGIRAWRSVRQHRPRLQLDSGHAHGAGDGRLRRHRGWLCL